MPRAGLDRATVVAAGAAIADAEGLDAVTLARVAQQFGVKPPSLYNHVDGRDALVRAIGIAGLDDLAAALREAAVGRSGKDALLAASNAYRAFVKEHPGRYAAGAVTAPDDDPELGAAAAAVLDVMRSVLRAWDLDAENEIHALRAFRAAVHGFATLEANGGFGIKLDVDTSFDRLILALAEGLQVDHA